MQIWYIFFFYIVYEKHDVDVTMKHCFGGLWEKWGKIELKLMCILDIFSFWIHTESMWTIHICTNDEWQPIWYAFLSTRLFEGYFVKYLSVDTPLW